MAIQYTVGAGDTSLNDIAQKHGFTNYKAAGIASVPSGNFDLIRPGDVINIGNYTDAKSPAPAPVPPVDTTKTGGTPPVNTGGATLPDPKLHDAINGPQDAEINTGLKNDEPPTKDGNTADAPAVSPFASAESVINQGLTAPTSPNFEQTYNDQRTKYGVAALESSVADYTAQERSIKADLLAQQGNEQDKPVAMNVINGRMTEEGRQAQEKLDHIAIQKGIAVDQLKVANDAIDTLMKYKELDYNAAKDTYDKQLTEHLDLYKTLNSSSNVVQDNARANLTIFYNALQNGGATLETLTPEQKNTITKLEMTAGLPVGFYQTLQAKNPKADIISTTTREANGGKYADVLSRDANGKISSSSIYLGKSTGSGTEGDKKTAGYATINQIIDLKNAKDSSGAPFMLNGYFTAKGFKQLIQSAIEDGITRQDFITQYSDKIDPNGAAGYGLTSKEQTDLGI